MVNRSPWLLVTVTLAMSCPSVLLISNSCSGCEFAVRRRSRFQPIRSALHLYTPQMSRGSRNERSLFVVAAPPKFKGYNVLRAPCNTYLRTVLDLKRWAIVRGKPLCPPRSLGGIHRHTAARRNDITTCTCLCGRGTQIFVCLGQIRLRSSARQPIHARRFEK
jgi:hypothetical protein